MKEIILGENVDEVVEGWRVRNEHWRERRVVRLVLERQ